MVGYEKLRKNSNFASRNRCINNQVDLIDIIILILVAAGLVLGYMKGLVGQVATICGIALGIIACHLWGDWATQVLVEIVPETASWPEPEYTTGITANIVLFLLVFLGIKIVGAMFRSVMAKLHLGLIDRMGGALFCVFKYLLILSMVLNVWYMFSPDSAMFTKRHGMDNVPFDVTMKLAPSLLGVSTLPRIVDDLAPGINENVKMTENAD